MKLNNLLDFYFDTFEDKYERYIKYANQIFWHMVNFASSKFMYTWKLEIINIPQKVVFIITDKIIDRDEKCKGLCKQSENTEEYTIIIQWDKPKLMEDTIEHELTHLILFGMFDHDHDHGLVFTEFLRRFKRYYKSRLNK